LIQVPFESFSAAGTSFQVATLYGANFATLASATAVPRSNTSGALGWPFSWLAALISSWLEASGWAEFTLMPYLAVNALMISP
jgi:hypothetical protein